MKRDRTGAERAARVRIRKGAGLVHLRIDPNRDILVSWLLRENILTEDEAAESQNLARGLEKLIAQQALNNVVTFRPSKQDAHGVRSPTRHLRSK